MGSSRGDFNLIENAFATLKALRRKAADRPHPFCFCAAIGRIVAAVTPAECANFSGVCADSPDREDFALGARLFRSPWSASTSSTADSAAGATLLRKRSGWSSRRCNHRLCRRPTPRRLLQLLGPVDSAHDRGRAGGDQSMSCPPCLAVFTSRPASFQLLDLFALRWTDYPRHGPA